MNHEGELAHIIAKTSSSNAERFNEPVRTRGSCSRPACIPGGPPRLDAFAESNVPKLSVSVALPARF